MKPTDTAPPAPPLLQPLPRLEIAEHLAAIYDLLIEIASIVKRETAQKGVQNGG